MVPRPGEAPEGWQTQVRMIVLPDTYDSFTYNLFQFPAET
jgi:hypothetical protein